MKRSLMLFALGLLAACHTTSAGNGGLGADLGSSGGGVGGSGGTGGAGGGGSGGSGGTGGGAGGGGGGGSVDGGSGGTTPNPTNIPKPTGTCPTFAAGTVTFSPAGIAPRQARLWMTSAASTLHGPLVFYWYATTSSTNEVLYGLGQSVVDAITAKGGIVVAPVEDMPNGQKNQFPWYLVTGNQMDDLTVADEIVGCAIEKVGIDLRHIHSLGMSAGGLQTTRMSYLRSGYLASVATYSGGISSGVSDSFQDPSNLFAAMIFHGGATDTYGQLSFQMASESYKTALRAAGHFAFICDHSANAPGHQIPPAPAATSVWQFFQDHPFGTNPSPYAGGLPSGFLSYCTLD
ncbi:MAG: hypothetical protein ACXVCV_17340 [Polyangia bacterium]